MSGRPACVEVGITSLMDWNSIAEAGQKLINSQLFSALVTVVLSAPIATYFGLRAFKHQAKELIDAAITWQWTNGHQGLDEEPYLSIQNRSAVPAYIIRARYWRGLFFRREADKYAFAYVDPTDDSFPLEVKAQGVTNFPLSSWQANRITDKAPWYVRAFAWLWKRPYLWLEIRTMSGRRLMIPANDVTTWNKRARWLEGRWLPEPTPDWMKAQALNIEAKK